MTQRPYLNLGAGRIILPNERPAHHGLVDPVIYQYPLWHNVDRNPAPGVDECVDLFTYPWPWADNSYDGALLSHLCEHIPHEVQWGRFTHLNYPYANEDWLMAYKSHLDMGVQSKVYQDGWYAFFSELYRVLTDGALVHILSPYGWSQGAITDPTHTRYLTEHTFTHSMKPDPNSPFEYATGGIHFEMDEPARFGITEMFQHLVIRPDDNPTVAQAKQVQLREAFQTRINVAYDMAVKLRVVK